MCGIAVIHDYGESAPGVDREELLRTRDAMVARGPDAAGLWVSEDARVGLAHRRLTIVELSELGNQPMFSADGRLGIVFNGEIYNYRELREELAAEGYEFRSHSDTEVILALYRRDGEELVHRLRGMFAFAIWDARERSLFWPATPTASSRCFTPTTAARSVSPPRCAPARRWRDRGRTGPGRRKSLLLLGQHSGAADRLPRGALPSRRVDGAGRAGPLRRTARVLLRRPHLHPGGRGNEPAPEEVARRVGEALDRSIAHHLVADVPVGIFLSGGVDSTALAAAVSHRLPAQTQAVTLAFEEFTGTANDEVEPARETARALGIPHDVRWVKRDELVADLPRILAAMDQPTIDGINSYFVSKAAAEQGIKAIISGLGGDELFAGYPSFEEIPRWLQLARAGRPLRPAAGLLRWSVGLAGRLPGIGKRIPRKLAGSLSVPPSVVGMYYLRRGLFQEHEVEALVAEQLGETARDSFDPCSHVRRLVREGAEPRYEVIAALESSLYMRNQLLRDADWASMAHSLEVRVPLVDVSLLRELAPLLAPFEGVDKSLMLNELNREVLQPVLARPKSGFFTPVDRWIRESGLIRRYRYPAGAARDWAIFVYSRYLRGENDRT